MLQDRLRTFEDGNGRIARAITDMQLARADGSAQRFYSMSVQIRKERSAYYAVLEKIQKNTYGENADHVSPIGRGDIYMKDILLVSRLAMTKDGKTDF